MVQLSEQLVASPPGALQAAQAIVSKQKTEIDRLNRQMHTLRSIFLYLDRTYVMQTVAKRSLWEMGLQIFRSHLHARAEVTRKTVHGLLSLIESERNGDQVARPLQG